MLSVGIFPALNLCRFYLNRFYFYIATSVRRASLIQKDQKMNLRSFCLYRLRRSLAVLSLPILLVNATSAFAASQTITFPPIGDKVFSVLSIIFNGGAASSGLPTTLVSLTPDVCVVATTLTGILPLLPPGSRGVTTISTGVCTLRVSQDGDANFSPATPVEQSFNIAKAPQAITFPPIWNKIFRSTSILINGGFANSGLSTTLVSLTPGVCEIASVLTGILPGLLPPYTRGITSISTGVCTLRVSQDGNGNYLAAIPAEQSFNITPLTATPGELTLAPNIINPRAGTPITLTALIGGVAPNGVVSITTISTANSTVPVAGCANLSVSILPDTTLLPGNISSAIANCVTLAEPGSRTYTATYTNDAANQAKPVTISTSSPAAGPLDYSDLWWGGTAESGWGITIAQKGLQQFNAFYVYDASGKPVWYVMSGGSWNADYTRLTGEVYQPSGSPFGDYDARRLQIGAAVGTATIIFNSVNDAVFDYTLNGVTGKKFISRFKFGRADATPKISVKDVWWAGAGENGWGISIAQQERSLFATWYTYDADGKTTWFVSPGGTWDGTTYTGQLYSTSGSPWLGTVYNAAANRVESLGTLVLRFSDANRAIMTTTFNGKTITKTISRLAF